MVCRWPKDVCLQEPSTFGNIIQQLGILNVIFHTNVQLLSHYSFVFQNHIHIFVEQTEAIHNKDYSVVRTFEAGFRLASFLSAKFLHYLVTLNLIYIIRYEKSFRSRFRNDKHRLGLG